MRRKVKLVAGCTLIGLGVLGLLLPLLPGIPLLIAGLALVAPNHPWLRSLQMRLQAWRDKWKPKN